MADKIQPQPNDKPLPQAQAERGAQVTKADIRRARDKWRRRVPDFEERLADAAK